MDRDKNLLKEWIQKSREEQRKAPSRYLASYPMLVMDDESVMMSAKELESIAYACGRYEGTLPTGVFLGKMFIRGEYLCWYGINKNAPMTTYAIKSRKILVMK
jgi:hypothetical protein